MEVTFATSIEISLFESGSKTDFRYLNDSIMEMILFFVNFILPNSVRSAAENSTNYNVKPKNAAFKANSMLEK